MEALENLFTNNLQRHVGLGPVRGHAGVQGPLARRRLVQQVLPELR